MSSGFVSELEIAEKRRIRQEEWEKVRQASEPLEAPEEPYDHRSLFERLEEQKQKKQLEYEEAHKLKNMIKGLDDDEIEFLDLVDQKKLQMEQLSKMEERQELEDYRKKVQKLKENSLDERMLAEIRPAKLNCGSNSTGVKSLQQQMLLKGIVVKTKKIGEEKAPCKTDTSEVHVSNDVAAGGGVKRKASDVQDLHPEPKLQITGEGTTSGGLTCVGILPGLGSYYGGGESSDESDCSSVSDNNAEDSPQTKYDLLGRKIVFKTKEKST